MTYWLIFGKAIHSLSKIGEELYLEPLEYGLALKTVNSSRSAFSCFLFAPAFFLNYDDGRTIAVQGEGDMTEDDALKCKIGMKSCLSVFKSLSTLEKTVDKCKITMNMDQARLVFQLYCRHGIVKTHNLAFIECETLQAVFSKDLLPNRLTAQSRLLCDVVMNFQSNQEEVSLHLTPEKVSVKNFTDDEPDPQKVIHTEMSLDPDEFDNYQVGIDGEITFCLKELRAILAFSEGNNLPLCISFESAGKPVVFSIESDPSFEANFVLATLADPSSQASCSQQSTQVNRNSQKKHNHTNNIQDASHNVHRNRTQQRPVTNHIQPNTKNSVSENGAKKADEVQTVRDSNRTKRHARSQLLQSMCDDLVNDDPENPRQEQSTRHMDVETTAVAGVSVLNNMKQKLSTSEITKNSWTSRLLPEEDEESRSPVIPVQSKNVNTRAEDSSTDIEEEEDMVPGTPPSKKFRSSVFFGISQSSTQNSTATVAPHPSTSSITQQGQSQSGVVHSVLAADSDED